MDVWLQLNDGAQTIHDMTDFVTGADLMDNDEAAAAVLVKDRKEEDNNDYITGVVAQPLMTKKQMNEMW